MNYRHHFHAGNFADLLKHAALTESLTALQRDPAPLTIIDTHAGAGTYPLDPRALGEGEAAATRRLLEDVNAPAVFDALKGAVRAESGPGTVYPGSPLLVARALRRQDRLVACELRPDDHAALATRLRRAAGRAEALRADGYVEAVARLGRLDEGRALLLIDPPYERADDYARIVETLGRVLRLRVRASVLVWAPLKDLETLDRLVREVEALRPPPGFVAEVRLRPPLDPMRMNGCAVLLLNPPPAVEAGVAAACGWIAARLGESGASHRLSPLA